MPTIPSSLALDEKNHDLFLDATGNLAFYTETADIVGQRIRCRLQTVQGEWYQGPTVGVPMFDQVLVKNPNLVTLKHLFTSVIAGTAGVATVDSVVLTFDAATRTLTIKFSVTATDGTTVTGSI